MLNTDVARGVFSFVEILALLGIILGGVLFVIGLGMLILGPASDGRELLFISLMCIAADLPALMTVYIGKALLIIAETNTGLLQELRALKTQIAD